VHPKVQVVTEKKKSWGAGGGLWKNERGTECRKKNRNPARNNGHRHEIRKRGMDGHPNNFKRTLQA